MDSEQTIVVEDAATSRETQNHDEQQSTTGYGIISVSGPLLAQLGIILPYDEVTTQGQLKDAGLFAEIHRVLLLPDSYHIYALRHVGLRLWEIVVESESLPVPPEFATWSDLPRLVCWYHRKQDGSIILLEMKVEQVSELRSAPVYSILHNESFPFCSEREKGA